MLFDPFRERDLLVGNIINVGWRDQPVTLKKGPSVPVHNIAHLQFGRTLSRQNGIAGRRTIRMWRVGIRENDASFRQPLQIRRLDEVAFGFRYVLVHLNRGSPPPLVIRQNENNIGRARQNTDRAN